MPRNIMIRLSLIAILSLSASGCIGMVIGQTADAVVEVAKVPFKVGGAVIDVATGDDDEDKKKDK